MMYWLKGCKKCGGDLYLEKDKFGSYVSCLQCGAIRLDFEEARPVSVGGNLLERRPDERQAA